MKPIKPAKWHCLLVALGLEMGCRRAPDSATRIDAAHIDAARADVVAAVGDGSSTALAPTAASAVKTEPVGGRWVSCYANFRPTSTPEREVLRLGAACGAANGLIPLGSPATAEASDTPDEHHLAVQAGDCFRIFAVAEASVSDLGIEIIGPWGGTAGSVRSGDRWPVLNADSPICLFDSGIHTMRVRAFQGRGKYAFQVWRLP